MTQQYFQTESKLSARQTYLCCFGHNVSTVCEQESDCQISSEDAYYRIRNLWLELKDSQPEIAMHSDKNNDS